jgi:ribosomal protein S18 acetylase RimI-like enzyme
MKSVISRALDNPLWSSLTGLHAPYAHGSDSLKMYPAEMAPFAAVPDAGALSPELLEQTMGERDFVYFVGTLPQVEDDRFIIEPHDDILQMVCAGLQPSPKDATAAVIALDKSHVPAMLDLMTRVYPAYFRERTIEMGAYVGVVDRGELVAMAGLRMAPQGFREISGVCTDPRYAGRGLGGLLVRRLSMDVIADGMTPMLHQDVDNTRASRLYESLGFIERARLPMFGVRRCSPGE